MSDLPVTTQQTVILPSSTSRISDEVWTNATSIWINNHVRNSPIAGTVEVWNHLGLILPHLRNLLETELSRTSAR